MRFRFSAAVISTAIIIVAVLSCGPSFRRTYQSDNAFERCFDMDYNPSVVAGEKIECWTEWLDGYVYNQPDDKVEYAHLRLEELDDGVSIPGPPGAPGSFHERPRIGEDAQEEEVDTTLVSTSSDAGVPGGDGGVSARPPKTFDCEMICRTTFDACSSSCAGDDPSSCEAACNGGYKACMRSCFD